MNWQDIPVFIINRDNLERGFRRQVEWLKDAGMSNVNIVDNASTYSPLLKYYKEIPARVVNQVVNLGPWVFWDTKMHESQDTPYVVSDADCVPAADCPKDLVRKLMEVYERWPLCKKAGPGIRIDNIPDHYAKKQQVIDHETQFNLKEHRYGDVYDALIDTTFALYPAKSEFPGWGGHIRTAAPYVIEHQPWYEDSDKLSDEATYYREHVQAGWSCWEAKGEDTNYRRNRDAREAASH